MKIILLIAANLIFYQATAQTPSPDSLSTVTPEVSIIDFLHDVQQIRSNASGRVGAEKAVFDIYLTLSDERLLLEQQIIRKPCKGRYALPQTIIEYGFLPADSTFDTTLELFKAESKNWLDPESEPVKTERLRQIRDQLDRSNEAYRKRVSQCILPFYPQTVYPADSVLYLNGAQELQLQKIFAGRKSIPGGYSTSDFSIKRGSWGPIINRAIMILDIIFEQGLDRAYINALSGLDTGWGILMERTPDGRWRILEARTRYFIIS